MLNDALAHCILLVLIAITGIILGILVGVAFG